MSNCSNCDHTIEDCLLCSIPHERCNQIIDSLVECLKEACAIVNETGTVPIKWKKSIISATGKIFKIYRRK